MASMWLFTHGGFALNELEKLLAKRASTMERAEAIAAAGSDMSSLDSAKLEGCIQELKSLDARITVLEQGDSSADAAESRSQQVAELSGVVIPQAPAKHVSPYTRSISKGSNMLRSWLRAGTSLETQDDLRAISAGGATTGLLELRAGLVSNQPTGSYAVPETLIQQFETLLVSYCDILKFARVYKGSSGETLRIPVDADQRGANSSAVFIGETVADAERPITLEQRVLHSHTASTGILLFSYELLQDTSTNLESEVASAMAARIGRLLADKFTNGTGSNEPTGYLAKAGQAGGIEVFETTATAFGLDDLITLFSKLDPAHQASPNCRWVMSPATFAALCKLKDGTQRSYILETLANGPAPTLLGKPVTVNPHHGDISSTVPGIVVGDWNSGFAIRTVGNITLQKSIERYFETRQTAFRGLWRADSALLDTKALVGLKLKA